MNNYFKALLDFLIPKIGDRLIGSCVWQSGPEEKNLENQFLALLELEAHREVIQVLPTDELHSGSHIFDFLVEYDKKLLSEIGNRLLVSWFTNPEVLEAYGLSSRPLFPGGKHLKPTDWTILEPVFLRNKLYRE